MKYLLLICAEDTVSDEQGMEGQEAAAGPDAGGIANARTNANAPDGQDSIPNWTHGRGILVTGSPTLPAVEATLEFRGDGVLITDGPYAHMQGHIQGFDVIDCEQLEEVIELASRSPLRPGQPDLLR
jgi:hypothetical protein